MSAGDADLYVSDVSKSPTYTNYEVKANSCGEDVLDLSDWKKRPIYIGRKMNRVSKFFLVYYYMVLKFYQD